MRILSFDISVSWCVLGSAMYRTLAHRRGFSGRLMGITALSLAIGAWSAMAQTSSDWSRCGRNPNDDEAISACLSLIRSGIATGKTLEIVRNNLAASYGKRGMSWLRKGERDRALADFSEAIRVNPTNEIVVGVIYIDRGAIWLAKGEFDHAISDFSLLIRRNPRDAHAYNDRGDSYAGKGDYNRAIADYGEALHIEPRLTATYFGRAASFEKRGEYERALADYEKALQLRPGDGSFIAGMDRVQAKLAKQRAN